MSKIDNKDISSGNPTQGGLTQPIVTSEGTGGSEETPGHYYSEMSIASLKKCVLRKQ